MSCTEGRTQAKKQPVTWRVTYTTIAGYRAEEMTRGRIPDVWQRMECPYPPAKCFIGDNRSQNGEKWGENRFAVCPGCGT